MYIISMKEVILMIYIILTIIAVLLSTLIMGVANKGSLIFVGVRPSL